MELAPTRRLHRSPSMPYQLQRSSMVGHPTALQVLQQSRRRAQRAAPYTAPLGVSITAATGDINLAASTPGTYTNTYSFTSGGCRQQYDHHVDYDQCTTGGDHCLPWITLLRNGHRYGYTNRTNWRNLFCTGWGIDHCCYRRYQSSHQYARNLYDYL